MTATDVPARAHRPGSPRGLDPAGLTAVDAVLADHVARHAATLVGVGPELGPLVDAIHRTMAGGKRLRAAFCLWGARAAGSDAADPAVVSAAAALEMFHLAALVHDDVMDHSDARRGQPTVHRWFADHHAADCRLGDSEEHGAAVAVLVGDLCLTWSDDLLAEAADASIAAAGHPAYAAGARAVWTRMRDQVLAGQHLDLLGQTRAGAPSGAVRRVLRYKSASYTVEHPLLLGAALAGATPDLADALGRFGLAVGEAFQLRDDVLGVFGEPAVTGKPAVDDVREGKRTLLVACAEEAGTPEQRWVLRRHLGDPGVDEAGLHAVRKVLVATGALDRVEARIEELVAEATSMLTTLAALSVAEDVREALASLTDACAWRTS